MATGMRTAKKEQVRLAQQQFCTCMYHAFLYIFLPLFPECSVNFSVSRFVKDVNTEEQFSFSKLKHSPSESTPKKFANI